MLLAVYGTLRKGCRLNGMMGANAKLLGTDRIFGYDMYHNGSYPYAVPSSIEDGKNNSILVEIWDVDTKPAIEVMRLELSAGYDLRDVPTTQGVAALLEYSKHRSGLMRILNGDFVEWCQKYHNGNDDFYNERNDQ